MLATGRMGVSTRIHLEHRATILGAPINGVNSLMRFRSRLAVPYMKFRVTRPTTPPQFIRNAATVMPGQETRVACRWRSAVERRNGDGGGNDGVCVAALAQRAVPCAAWIAGKRCGVAEIEPGAAIVPQENQVSKTPSWLHLVHNLHRFAMMIALADIGALVLQRPHSCVTSKGIRRCVLDYWDLGWHFWLPGCRRMRKVLRK